MDATKQHVVDGLLRELKAGNREAFSELLPLVYGELHNVAARQRQNWDGDETLNTTALIHEAYIRLADQSAPEWQSYPHFLAVASTAMRQILIDYTKRNVRRSAGENIRTCPSMRSRLPWRRKATAMREQQPSLLSTSPCEGSKSEIRDKVVLWSAGSSVA